MLLGLFVRLRERVLLAAPLWVLLLATGPAAAQPPDSARSVFGTPVVRTISPQAYDGNGQVWDVAQDGRGLLYIASSYGLQQYDGARWRYLPTANETTPWAIARTTAGTLYVGARNELGHYRPDSLGRLTYRSLLGRVPSGQRPVGNVRDAVATEQAVFFRAETGVLRWPGPDTADSLQVVADSSATGLFQCRDASYVHRAGDRLYRIEGATLVPVDGTARLADATVVDLIRNAESAGCQVATERQGRFRITPAGLAPLAWPAGPLDEPVQDVARGPEGALAVATNSSLRLVGPRGQIQELSRGDALPDGNLGALYLSDRHALWVATNSGVARVAWPDPVSLLREPPALQTTMSTIARHEGRLVAATRDGVWQIDPKPARQLAETGDTFDLLSTGTGLLVASRDGLAVVRDGQPRFLTESIAYELHRGRHAADVVYVSQYQDGLLRLRRRGGQWQIADRTDRIDAPIYTIAEDTGGRLWLGAGHRGLLRLDAAGADLDAAPLARFDTTDGLPGPNFNYSLQLGDSLRFITAQGLYRVADSSFAPDEAFAPAYADDVYRHWPVVPGPDESVWMDFGGRKFGVATGWPDGPVRWTARPFRRLADLGDVQAIYPDAARDSLVWIAAENSVVRHDRRLERFGGHAQSVETLVRGVRTRGDSLLYGGDTEAAALPADVGFEHANLRFEFGATSYEQIEGPTHNWDRPRQYRWRLDGVDAGWTDWTTEPQADYTNLPPGTHTMHVQTRNLYHVVGEEAQLTVTVLPPWYRTWWAYGGYGLMGLLLVAGAVQWRTRRLRRRQRELEATVDERTEALRKKNEQLAEQTEKLKALDAAKDRFFANLSHEFRTPLTLVRGPVQEVREALERGTLDPAEQTDQLAIAERNAARLQRLIDQILGLARLEAGTYELAARPTALSEAVPRLVRQFEPLAERHALALTVETETVHGDADPAYVDREALEHVVGNLLSNAIKFTPEGGRVRVTIAEAADHVTVAVGDTGPGIPEAEREAIFDRFQQVDDTVTREQEGTGIGLAFAQDLVTLHGGTITVESTEGEGTTFTVRLPRGADHLSDDQIAQGTTASPRPSDEAEPPAEPADEERVPSALSPSSLDSQSPSPSSPSERAPAPDPGSTPAEQSQRDSDDRSKVVLIVDDNADVRRYVRSILEPTFTVLEAADGADGATVAREELPDVILADVMMPSVDGHEMTRRLKEDPETEAIPVIMVTARAETSDEVTGLQVGADDYVTKPFDADVLRQRVGGVLTLQERLRRRLTEELREEGPKKAAEPDERPEIVREARRVARDHLTDPDFNVEALAGEMAMSRSTLYRRLSDASDHTPSSLLTSVRIEKARELLKEGEPVTQVAYAVGYERLSTFSSVFKEHVGESPSAIGATTP